MSLPRFIRPATAAILLTTLAACSRSSTPGGPTPPVIRPSLTVTAISVVGLRGSAGYEYRTVVQLRESGGAAATIAAADLTFSSGATTVASAHYDRPLGEGATACPASGSISTRELVTVDHEGSHPYATGVRVQVTFSDGAAYTATAAGAADVPPLAAPPEPRYTLTGVITDGATRAPIAGALLEVRGGLNLGRTATTDGSGTYVLGELLADTFRLRASKDGYGSGEQGVTVPDNPRADFELRVPAAPCSYSVAANAPDIVPWTGGEYSIAVTRTSGACSWEASTDAQWITFPRGTTGNGSASLVFAVGGGVLDTRSGSIHIGWSGGGADVRIQQGPRPDWICTPVALSKGPEDFDNVPSGGGTVSVNAAAPAIPPEWASACRASLSSSVPWITGGATVEGHGTFTFTVAPNPSPGVARSGAIVVAGPGGTATVAVTQR
jgi:hypothetical protein